MAFDLFHAMGWALEEARKAYAAGEIPVGAVLLDAEGDLLARDHNRSIALHDPTAHAEILVLRQAGTLVRNYRLTKTCLVVTLEPCLMCMGAALHARVGTLAFGALDPKAGAAGSLYSLHADPRLNHRMEVLPGILGEACGALLQEFFKNRRRRKEELPLGEVPKWP